MVNETPIRNLESFVSNLLIVIDRGFQSLESDYESASDNERFLYERKPVKFQPNKVIIILYLCDFYLFNFLKLYALKQKKYVPLEQLLSSLERERETETER